MNFESQVWIHLGSEPSARPGLLYYNVLISAFLFLKLWAIVSRSNTILARTKIPQSLILKTSCLSIPLSMYRRLYVQTGPNLLVGLLQILVLRRLWYVSSAGPRVLSRNTAKHWTSIYDSYTFPGGTLHDKEVKKEGSVFFNPHGNVGNSILRSRTLVLPSSRNLLSLLQGWCLIRKTP